MSRRWTALFLYDLMLWVAALVLLPVVLWKWCRSASFRRRLPWRLGFGPTLEANPRRILLHGVSVGEVKALKPLLTVLEREFPDHELLLSSSTPTGLEFARRLYPERHLEAYPLDFTRACARFLDRLQPRLVILAELEIWPNFLRQCSRRGIAVAIVNGRITERSMSGYRRVQRWLPQFDRIALYGAQNQRYAERFSSLAVPEERVRVTGNLKFDDLPRAQDEAHFLLSPWRRWAEVAPLVVWASTHAPEEVELMRRWVRRAVAAEVLTVVVPRHPQRIEALLQELAPLLPRPPKRFTALAAKEEVRAGDTIVVDTFGELGAIYRAARAAFVGGSLCPHGGQNMLEAAAVACPVVVGPHVENFLEEVTLLQAAGGLKQVAKEAQVLEWLEAWVQDPEAAQRVGRAGRSGLDSGRGAAQSTVDALRQGGLLPLVQASPPSPGATPR